MQHLTRANTKIGLLDHVGGGNLGDDATLDAIAGAIRRRWPCAEIVAFSMNPDDTSTRHGIQSHPLRRDRWRIGGKPAGTGRTFKTSMKALTRNHGRIFYLLRAGSVLIRSPSEMFRELSFLASSRRIMGSFDLLIVSGGGQLTEKNGPWGFPYTLFKWVMLARSAGVPCLFLNVGAGPLTGPLSKFFVRRALLTADYVSLRDEKSQALVRQIGFTRECQVCPDNVYALEIAPTRESVRETGSQSIVGFAPMPYPDPGPDGYRQDKDQIVYDAFIRKLASFACWLVSRSHALEFFGTDVGADLLAIKDVQQALLRDHGLSPRQSGVGHSIESVHDLLAAMSGMDYIITCRFHGVVFAHLLNKPVLAIAHHPKVAELMAELDLSSYCVDIRDFDASLLATRFAAMVVNADEIKSRLAASLTRNKQRLRKQLDGLFSLSPDMSADTPFPLAVDINPTSLARFRHRNLCHPGVDFAGQKSSGSEAKRPGRDK